MLIPCSHAGVKAPGEILAVKQQCSISAVSVYSLLFIWKSLSLVAG